jgi:hypothetical protein
MALPKMDSNKIFASIIKSQAKDRLEEFRQYTLEIEAKFDSDKKSLANSYDEAIKGLSEDQKREIDDYFADDYYIIDEIHVGLYRKSTLVSVYSCLENALRILCRHLCARHGYPVKLDDLRGEGIVRAKDYLEKLAKVDFSALNDEWSHLMTLNRIRNCIVHCEGDIKSSTSAAQLQNIVNKTRGLFLRNERYIRVEREYVDSGITKAEKFLDKLYQQVFSS